MKRMRMSAHLDYCLRKHLAEQKLMQNEAQDTRSADGVFAYAKGMRGSATMLCAIYACKGPRSGNRRQLAKSTEQAVGGRNGGRTGSNGPRPLPRTLRVLRAPRCLTARRFFHRQGEPIGAQKTKEKGAHFVGAPLLAPPAGLEPATT